MELKNKLLFFVFGLVLIITFFIYLPIAHGTFQHDEWAALSRFFLFKPTLIETLREAFTPFISHYVPFHRTLVEIYIGLFGLNYWPYTLASISAHLLITFLLFIFFTSLFGNRLYALLASSLFAFGAAGHQATSWPLADISVHGATIFGLVSLIFLFKFIDDHHSRNILISLVFLLASLLFKEIAIGFFLLFPFALYLFKPKLLKKNKKVLPVIFGVTLFYLVLRGAMFFTPRSVAGDELVTADQSYQEIVTNIATFPIKTLAQTTIPVSYLLKGSRMISSLVPVHLTGQPGTTAFDQFVEGITLQIIGGLVFLMFILLGIKFIGPKKNKKLVKIYIFAFVFIVINSLIYVLSPGRGGDIPVIDSRNLYFPLIGTSILIVSSLVFLAKGNKTRIFLFFIPILVLNVVALQKEISNVAQRGILRKKILDQIKNDYPKLPDRVVFYAESDTSFYGLPENEKILPFQTNFGSDLFIWYLPQEKFPAELADNGWFLHSLTGEGYKEFAGRGFGYFRDLDNLRQAVAEYGLEPDTVIAYRYDSQKAQLFNITREVRLNLEN